MNNIGKKKKHKKNTHFCILFYCQSLVYFTKGKRAAQEIRDVTKKMTHWEPLQFYNLLFRFRIKRYNQTTYLTDENEEFAAFGMGFFFFNSCSFDVFQLFLLFRAPHWD